MLHGKAEACGLGAEGSWHPGVLEFVGDGGE